MSPIKSLSRFSLICASIMLLACAGEKSQSVSSSDTSATSSASSPPVSSSSSDSGAPIQVEPLPDDDGGFLCIDQYEPVCAIEPVEVQCLVAPCPVGIYHTASNECNARSKGWEVAFEDVCGELEDQPVEPQPTEEPPSDEQTEPEVSVCTDEYAPVCTVERARQPCLTVPCPAPVYKTYSNECNAGDALVLFAGSCGEQEGEIVSSPLDGACTQQYDPVCGKVNTNIVCVTTPCPSSEYKTFGNACAAGNYLANIAFTGECGDLEGVLVEDEPPVVVQSALPDLLSQLNVAKATIENDVLILVLEYSSCSGQHFDLYISNQFAESDPVQASYGFVPAFDEACDSPEPQSSTFRYDLRPIQHRWQALYQQSSGVINLGELGVYSF